MPDEYKLLQFSPDTKDCFLLIQERDRFYLQRFSSMEELTKLALSNAKEAVTKAETANERRFESVNEFRNTLRDQQSTLLSKPEADIRFKSLEQNVATLTTRLDAFLNENKGRGQILAYGIAALSAIVAIAVSILSHWK